MRLIFIYLMLSLNLSANGDSLNYRIFNLDSRYDSFANFPLEGGGYVPPKDEVYYADYDSSILVCQYKSPYQPCPPDDLIQYYRSTGGSLAINGILFYRMKLTKFDLNGKIHWIKYLNVPNTSKPNIHILNSEFFLTQINRALPVRGRGSAPDYLERIDTILMSSYSLLNGELIHQDSIIKFKGKYNISFHDTTYTILQFDSKSTSDTTTEESRFEVKYGIKGHRELANNSRTTIIVNTATLLEQIVKFNYKKFEERYEGVNCIYTKYQDSVTILDKYFRKIISNKVLQDSILNHYWIVSADYIGDSLVFCLLKRTLDLSNKDKVLKSYKAEIEKQRKVEMDSKGYNTIDFKSQFNEYYTNQTDETKKWIDEDFYSGKFTFVGFIKDSGLIHISYKKKIFRKLYTIVIPDNWQRAELKSNITISRYKISKKSNFNCDQSYRLMSIHNRFERLSKLEIQDTLREHRYDKFYYYSNSLFWLHQLGVCYDNLKSPNKIFNDKAMYINILKIYDGKKYSSFINDKYNLEVYKKDIYRLLYDKKCYKFISVIKVDNTMTKAFFIDGKYYQVSGEPISDNIVLYINGIDNLSETDQLHTIINKYFKVK